MRSGGMEIIMKIVVLDAETLGEDISLKEIEACGHCDIYLGSNEQEVKERIKDAEVVIINKIKLSADVLNEAKSLKLICVAATGYDNIDVEYCRANGIAVSNVVGYSSHSVAQLTAAMVLALSVNLKQYTNYVESGKYTKSGVANRLTPVYHELFGKVWGIVGYGNIGKEVAQIASALGCRIIVNKQTPTDEAEAVSLEELCKRADIITVHTPLTEKTRGMFSKERIALMKKDVIFVNTARGAVTDEQAICDALTDGKIGAFGTDVYSIESFGTEHPFNKIKDMENVCLTPHMAWGSYEARCRCVSEIAKNIKAFIDGQERNRVDLI